MRRKKPVRASIDWVRITRHGTTAVIDRAARPESSVNLTIGDDIHGMTEHLAPELSRSASGRRDSLLYGQHMPCHDHR